MHDLGTTIIAPSTSLNSAALAVIRLSGPETYAIIKRHFPAVQNKRKIQRGLQFGNFTDSDGKAIDEVVVSFFPGPHSYTKQDTAEISCHGSPYIIDQIIDQCCKSGATMAMAGEFTYRAFLNGRMDLAQAEAVTDLIASSTKAQHQIAFQQLKGSVSDDIKILRQQLIDFASLIELELDFGEEDVEFADRTELTLLVDHATDHITQLIKSFDLGNAIKEGVPIAIVGKPNAGKSTLLNALLKEERAIVSDIPGTTRDSIEDVMNIHGIMCRFIDTAGLRETKDAIEAEGVKRAVSIMDRARIMLYLIDVNDASAKEVAEMQKTYKMDADSTILVINKMDAHPYAKAEDFAFPGRTLPISAKNNMNIEALKETIFDMLSGQQLSEDSVILSNLRHKEAFQKALEDLIRVKEGLNSNLPGDLVAMDIRQALYHIGMITGEISADDLLGNIFSRFCIGK